MLIKPFYSLGTEPELRYSDVDGTPGSGDPANDPALEGNPEGDPESFYKWNDLDGKEMNFANPDEVGGHLNNVTKRYRDLQSDFSRRTDEWKNREGEITRREAAVEARAREIGEGTQEFKTWRQFMQQRPEVYQEFQQRVTQPASAEDAYLRSKSEAETLVESLRQEVAELKSWRDETTFEKNKDSIFSRLKGKHADFNGKAAERVIAEIGKDQEKLAEFAYYASKGQGNDLAVQRLAADELKDKERTAGIITGGSAPKGTGVPRNMEDARAAAHASNGE